MKNCNEIQQLIAECEFNPIEDKAVLLHVQTCQECQEYQQALNEMNQAMGEMTDFDAEDSLVESTLSSIVSLQDEAQKPKRLVNTQWASALAASFMLVSLIALFPYNSISNFGISSVSTLKLNNKKQQSEDEQRAIAKRKELLQKKKAPKKADYEFYEVDLSEEVVQKQRRVPQKPTVPKVPRLRINDIERNELAVSSVVTTQMGYVDSSNNFEQGFSDAISNQAKLEAPKPVYSQIEENKPQSVGNELVESVSEYKDEQDDKVELDRVVTTGSHIRATDLSSSKEQVVSGFSVSKHSNGNSLEIPGNYTDVFAHRYSKTISQDDKDELNSVTITGSRIKTTDLESPAPVYSIDRESTKKDQDYNVAIGKLNKSKENHDLETSNNSLVGSSESKAGHYKNAETKRSKGVKLNSDGVGQVLTSPYIIVKDDNSKKDSPAKFPLFEAEEVVQSIAPLTLAQQYLSDMNSLDNLNFQTASGYWANTYLPGDSSMRLLQASLADNTTMALNNSISQNIQPFDYPTNSALAVYLNSDVANVQSQQPKRMRIQVGIQASNRLGGQRSAMNIGLVFDTNNKTPEYVASMKALLLALLKSKQPGDNISLTVAGNTGGNNGVLIEPKDFRHGKIQVVMNNLFSDEQKNTKGLNRLNLNQAIKLASEKLMSSDDATATLGSSVILLFSANKISDMSGIESMVHANALKGITMSTVSLGSDNHQQLKQLALAGQGHARILNSNNNIIIDAKRVIDAGLLASSRAVARALRLRIRLAKGVKLIEVIDSYNLNEKQSQRVRDAETSLDKRLSKNLGIKTDRGEDEEGIQIVIPSFFAGDTHVILLDVVATDANAIADITMRYKDLLYLRNAISRKQLSLENNPKALGPLQYNVMKNALAVEFSKSIKQAGAQIRQGNHSQALETLINMQKLYQSLREQFPVWNKDQEILKDEKLLQEYINTLNSISINDVQKINYIVDSMQYISWRKHITTAQ